jgi:hypothetical protein
LLRERIIASRFGVRGSSFIGFLIDHGSAEGGGQRRRWEKRGKKEKAES